MGSEKIDVDEPPVALQGSSQYVMLLKDKKNICCLESDNYPIEVFVIIMEGGSESSNASVNYHQVVPPTPTAMSRVSDETHTMRVGVTKKRGRPRKYQSLNFVTVGMTSDTMSTPTIQSPEVEATVAARGSEGNAFDYGILVGAAPLLAPAAAFGSRELTPCVLDFKSGQDISKIIEMFSYLGPACILSAHGILSQVVLRHPETSGGTISYEGRFEILSLSGLLLPESSCQFSETGGLSMMLGGQNGWVFGGRLAGIMIAASAVKVILGRFISDCFPETLASASTQN